MARKEVPVEEIVATSPEHLQPLTNKLRRIVKVAAPDATEHGYPGWRGIGYRHPVAGYFCGIFPQKDNVRLLFEYGRHLEDPESLLTQGGTQAKWAALRELDSATEDHIRALVDASIAFGVLNKGRLATFRRTKP